MKLLGVEDEAPAAAFLRRGFAEEGFAVDVAVDAGSADEAVAVNEYDAIVLDVMLPGGDGFSLCRRWRRAGLTTPILFLTARDEIAVRVQGLDLGADDYLVKPFAFAELLARVRALLRRVPALPAPPELRVADVVIDTARRRVTRQGRPVPPCRLTLVPVAERARSAAEASIASLGPLKHEVRRRGDAPCSSRLFDHTVRLDE